MWLWLLVGQDPTPECYVALLTSLTAAAKASDQPDPSLSPVAAAVEVRQRRPPPPFICCRRRLITYIHPSLLPAPQVVEDAAARGVLLAPESWRPIFSSLCQTPAQRLKVFVAAR